MKQFTKTILKAAAITALFAGQALADPLATVPPGTSIQFKYDNFENPIITAAGQTLSGILTVTSIINNANNQTLWASDVSDGTELTGFFTGLVSQTPVASGTGGFDIGFTGGTLTMYNVATGSFNPTSPADPLQSQICPGGVCPAPYLTFSFVPGIVPSNPTVTLQSHVSTLTAPLTGSGFGRLEVTGGTAASRFGIGSQFSLNSNFSSCGTNAPNAALCANAGAWPLASFDPVTGRTIPEPGTLLLLGLGAVGAAAVRRMRKAA